MTSDQPALQIVLTPMTPGRDEEFAEMLEEFRAAGEYYVYDGNFAIAWNGYAGLYDLLARMKAGGYPRPDIVPMDSISLSREDRFSASCTSAIVLTRTSSRSAATLATRSGPLPAIEVWPPRRCAWHSMRWPRSASNARWLRATRRMPLQPR